MHYTRSRIIEEDFNNSLCETCYDFVVKKLPSNAY